MNRGPLGVPASRTSIGVSTMLTGSLRATGQLATTAAGGLGGAIGGVLGKDLGRSVEKLAGRTLDQRTDIRGNVAVISQPQLTPAWRLEPNLTTHFSIADANMTIVGVGSTSSNEVRPLLERQVNEQVGALQARLRNDPFLEQVARREWAKLCRSLSIGAAGAGLPNLWLELRPTRAIAAQPRVDAEAVTLLVGVEAETRIVPSETKPDCPFPATLEILPQGEQGRVNIAVPIDVPFTEVNRLIEAQFAGKTFREDEQRVRRHGAPRQRRRVRRSAADLAARQGHRAQELVRPRHRGERLCLGTAGARCQDAGAAAHRRRARRRIGRHDRAPRCARRRPISKRRWRSAP